MILGGLRVSWWSVGVGVVGVGAGRGLRLGGRRFRACHSWLVVGRFVLLVGWYRLTLVLGRLVLWVVGGGLNGMKGCSHRELDKDNYQQ